MMKIKATLLATLLAAGSMGGHAQLSKNPTKFLGNITTAYSVRSDFNTYWNQLTPENETKWASVEGTRDVYNWSSVDKEYQYCKDHNFPFKFHTLIWGSQYPSWMDNLSQADQSAEIIEWFDAAAKRYPDVQYIDVVNEAIPGHAPAPYKNALGGNGVSGYDWIVKAFVMARERWPKAVLIYNDYNTFQWNTDAFIDLLNKIKNAGAPIDAAGCQSHDLNDLSGATFKTVLEKIRTQTGLPIVISEYDINLADDQLQLTRYKEQIPVMWEADYVAGITLWGYIYGSTWVDYSGLIKDGVERPALTWLRQYMLTDAAIKAKSPTFTLGKYAFINPTAGLVAINTETTIKAKAYSEKDNIAKMKVYVNNALLMDTATSSLELKWKPTVAGTYAFRLKVYNAADSLLFEKVCSAKAYEPSTPFKTTPITLPGILQAEDFDKGINGVAFSDTDDKNDGGKYRTDVGVDIGSQATNEYFVGWTSAGEWLEYTVKVDEAQVMVYSARVSSANANSVIRIYMGDVDLTGKIPVPQSANSDWSVYNEVKGRTKVALPVGTYKLRIVIESSSCNIDKVTFTKSLGNEVLTTPYGSSPIALPGELQAELYDKGTEGTNYMDNESQNRGDAGFRTTEGVDIVKGNGGQVVGYTVTGEWMLYTVTVAKGQVYNWSADVASGVSGSAFSLYMGTTNITGKIQVPQTGSNTWGTYTKVTGNTTIALPAGTYQLKLVIESGNCDIDKVTFTVPTELDPLQVDNFDGVYEVFSVTGIHHGKVNINKGDISGLKSRYPDGLYILRKSDGRGVPKRILIH
jgi:GH35 family endo-1,4-beta-xylanase